MVVEILADIRSRNFNTDDTGTSGGTSTQVVGTQSKTDDILTQELTTQVKTAL